jgi:hypothetical protein
VSTAGPPGRRGREALLRLALACVSLVVTLLLLEGAARVVRYVQRPGKEAGEKDVYHEYDPLLGWRKKAGATVTYRRREYTVEVSINSHGQRDSERACEKAPGVFRVLALGDSFLEAYTVASEQMATRVLETSLAKRGCRAEVLNAGTAGYSTDQEYLYYASEGVKFSPDVVVLFFFYNDIVYTDRQDYFGQPKPVFEMRKEGLVLHRYPVRRKPKEAAAAREAATVDGKDGGGPSALLELLSDRLWYGAPRAYNALARLGLWDPMPKAQPRLELLVYDRRTIPQIEDAWSKVAAVLARLQAETAASGTRLVVAYVPSRMEVQDRSWELTRALYRLGERDWDRGKVLAKLREIGAEAGFPVLDLTPGLRAAERGPFGTSYFTYDGHWNATGHRVVAGTVEAFLREKDWLASCARP